MSPDGAATGAPGPQPDDDPDGHISWSIGLRETRDRKRRERAVIQAVGGRSHGRGREDIAADLARSFAGAGIPQLPEAVALHAGFIAGGRLRGVLRLLGTVRHLRDRQGWTGTRPATQRLAGDCWIGVTMSGDAAAGSTVRWWAQAHRDVNRHTSGGTALPRESPFADVLSGPAARLTMVPPAAGSEPPRIGVFLGGTFVGTVPDTQTGAAALRATIESAESDGRRLMVRSRFDATGTGEAPAMSVALP
jgi:hypothetical protein